MDKNIRSAYAKYYKTPADEKKLSGAQIRHWFKQHKLWTKHCPPRIRDVSS
jgi:hypothetical protein